MDIRALMLLTIVAIIGCDVPSQQDAQFSLQPVAKDSSESTGEPEPVEPAPAEPEPIDSEDPRLFELKILSILVNTNEDTLRKKGLYKEDRNIVEWTLAEVVRKHSHLPPDKLLEMKIGTLSHVEKILEKEILENPFPASSSPTIKTLRVRRRSFDYPEDLMDLQKVSCKGLGRDDLLCKITFKLLRDSSGVKFDLSDKDGAHLNYPTVGIRASTPVGVITKQEIIVPRSTRKLAFLER